MRGNCRPYATGHFGLFPNLQFAPTYLYHEVPAPELAIELDTGWRMHIRMDQAGADYLRKLAAIINVAANVAEESAAQPTLSPAMPVVTARNDLP
jgi:hypothetical protein